MCPNKIVATYHLWIRHPRVIHNGADCERTKTAIFSAHKEEIKSMEGDIKELGIHKKRNFVWGSGKKKKRKKNEDGPRRRWQSDSGSKGLTPGAGESAAVSLGEKSQAKKEPRAPSPDRWRKN